MKCGLEYGVFKIWNRTDPTVNPEFYIVTKQRLPFQLTAFARLTERILGGFELIIEFSLFVASFG